MKKNHYFYYCTLCGNIVEMIHDSGNVPSCCQKPMVVLEAGTSDGKAESHVPIWKIDNHKVQIQVGEKIHPSVEEHYIEWIEIVTNKGIYRHFFKPGMTPEWKMKLCDDERIAVVYAYCNLHHLYKAVGVPM